MDFVTLIGVAGASFLLIAFAANAFGKLPHDSKKYQALNLLGGALLTWYGYLLHSWPFVFLEGVWTLVAFWHLCRLAGKGKNG